MIYLCEKQKRGVYENISGFNPALLNLVETSPLPCTQISAPQHKRQAGGASDKRSFCVRETIFNGFSFIGHFRKGEKEPSNL
jgi:hypothetical protein